MRLKYGHFGEIKDECLKNEIWPTELVKSAQDWGKMDENE